MSRESLLIANTLSNMRDNLAGIASFLATVNHPDYGSLLQRLRLNTGSTISFGRKGGAEYTALDLHASVARIRGNPQFNLDYIGAFLMATVSLVADRLAINSYFNKTPELEFLRHVRNAISHGNKFHFLRGEPRRPACFEAFALSTDLEGSVLFWDFMMPGDVLALFDEIEKQLRALP